MMVVKYLALGVKQIVQYPIFKSKAKAYLNLSNCLSVSLIDH
jgi:hypothetical protein